MVRKNNFSKTKKSIIKDSNALVGSFSFIKKCGWNMVLLIPIGKINSFTVSRCFISHIHSLIIGILRAAEQFQKFKICNSNYFPVLHILFIYKAKLRLCSWLILETSPPDAAFSDWGFCILYFSIFCISIIFCFYC